MQVETFFIKEFEESVQTQSFILIYNSEDKKDSYKHTQSVKYQLKHAIGSNMCVFV